MKKVIHENVGNSSNERAERESASIASEAVPKVLLLSGTAPGPEGVGGIVLQELCRYYPIQSLSVYVVTASGQEVHLPTDLAGVPVKTGAARYEQIVSSHFGRAGKFISWLGNQHRFKHHINKCVADSVAYARKHNVERVWAVLDTPASIHMALPVARALGVPLVSMVWDDIQYNTSYFRLDRLSSRSLLKVFGETLRASERCAVIGETMESAYQKEYSVPCVIVRHGVARDLIKSPVEMPGDNGSFRIGFAGSVYARSAFQMLVKTLDTLNWSVAGRDVILRLIGHRFDLSTHRPAQIEYLGWRTLEEDSIALLSECDVNYLPQPFEDKLLPIAALSFPAKLTTYLAAGRPILLHAPSSASLPKFFRSYEVGTWCSSLEQAELERALVELLTDRNIYKHAISEIPHAIEDKFTNEILREKFAKFIGVDTSALN